MFPNVFGVGPQNCPWLRTTELGNGVTKLNQTQALPLKISHFRGEPPWALVHDSAGLNTCGRRLERPRGTRGGCTFTTVALLGRKTNDTFLVSTGQYFEYQFCFPEAHGARVHNFLSLLQMTPDQSTFLLSESVFHMLDWAVFPSCS